MSNDSHFDVRLQWDEVMSIHGLELDLCALLLDENDKFENDQRFVYYVNNSYEQDSVRCGKDERTGGGENLRFNLDNVPHDVTKIIIVVSIYDAANRQLSFKNVKNAQLHFKGVDDKDNVNLISEPKISEIIKGLDPANYSAIEIGYLIRYEMSGEEFEKTKDQVDPNVFDKNKMKWQYQYQNDNCNYRWFFVISPGGYPDGINGVLNKYYNQTAP